jgi:hypothetical protein
VSVTTPGPSPYGCQIKHRAVVEAIAELGIVNDVVIEWYDPWVPPGVGGVHEGWQQGEKVSHTIRLSIWNRPETVSRTLWHELEHARQNEALGLAAFDHAYKLGGGDTDDNPFEIEAREVAEGHDDVLLTDGSKFDPTVPDAAWRSWEEHLAKGQT